MDLKIIAAGLALTLASFSPAFAQAKDPHSGHDMGAMAQMGAMGDMLAASSPANNATLKSAPKTLSLTFMHPVMLQTVAITGPKDQPVRATFRRPQAPTAAYAIALPPLAAGAYHVTWSASGGGHDMKGELHFTVQ